MIEFVCFIILFVIGFYAFIAALFLLQFICSEIRGCYNDACKYFKKI